ncbi:PD-(D/E)XK nuclease family protein [Nitratifractor salsuginis]|uniref:PD-(D/E)XK endonuclease-like domain-containing protein n=1 Tax=Nitratifractor salsuginis (strain DSM 16511 / JCM 12458 / E9I37-1) TaxID=749222 RepID=E6X2G9_NITSE|nr:PD-(D/E)XK nuclease family protein [Nitratifractor salsuginis]ADV47174.1 hypothetical protein Nitsa_1931 [Nitratifractor salsuginis DSM 16511]
MSLLKIYPTARAIREELSHCRTEERFLPQLMRMDEFINRLVRVPGRRAAEGSERIFWLREAAEFDGFSRLSRDRELIRFFTRSSDFFRFFEELAWEQVPLERLDEADAYAEYAEHIELLHTLKERYRAILDRESAYDRIFLPELYRFNESFLGQWERVELHLEGYLSRFEMELLTQAAKRAELEISWRSTPYNEKMRRRFADVGLELPAQSRLRFSLSREEVLEAEKDPLKIDARVLAVQERYEQVAVALAEIEGMVHRGISPDRIALVLPDEGLMQIFDLYDRMDNLNFSMGYDYRDRPEYRLPAALLESWNRPDEPEYRRRLAHYGLSLDVLGSLKASERCGVDGFLERFAEAKIPGFELPEPGREPRREEEPLWELRHRFQKLNAGRTLSLKEWLFLWLEEVGALRLDDVRGGKVTVMGVLETRGVAFDGVVIVDFNEGVVPASSGKDRFLDSRVRHFAGLPDRRDREALQKHYYARLLEGAKEAVILYATGENRLPTRFLYELGLEEGREVAAPRKLLYDHSPLPAADADPVVEAFDPTQMRWSASRLRTWLECKRRFYYRYIEGLEEKESEELNEGLFLHRVLEGLFRERDHYDDPEQMSREFAILAARELERHGSAGRYILAYWKRKLESYFREEAKRFTQGWRVESIETAVEGEIDGLRFGGRIDRIDRLGEARLALDYKSGSIKEANRKSNLDKLTDFQMSIYDLLLRSRFPELDLAFVTPLDGGSFVPVAALEEKNVLLLEHLGQLKQTCSFVAERCEDLKRCTWCPYQLLCERGEYL